MSFKYDKKWSCNLISFSLKFQKCLINKWKLKVESGFNKHFPHVTVTYVPGGAPSEYWLFSNFLTNFTMTVLFFRLFIKNAVETS